MNLIPDILEAAKAQIEKGCGQLQTGICVEISYAPITDQVETENRAEDGYGYRGPGPHALESYDETPKVLLVPSNLESSLLSRRSLQDDVSIDLAINVSVPREDAYKSDFIKGMFLLGEQLKHLLRPSLQTTPSATWIGSPRFLYDVNKLRNHGIFFSITTHTFRVLGAEP